MFREILGVILNLKHFKQTSRVWSRENMEFLQKLKISGGVNLSNLRPSRDNERTTSNASPTTSRPDSKEDVSLPPRGSPAAKKMKILLVIDSPDTDW